MEQHKASFNFCMPTSSFEVSPKKGYSVVYCCVLLLVSLLYVLWWL